MTYIIDKGGTRYNVIGGKKEATPVRSIAYIPLSRISNGISGRPRKIPISSQLIDITVYISINIVLLYQIWTVMIALVLIQTIK